MTHPDPNQLPPELRAIAQHYAQTPGSGSPPPAPAAPPQAPPPPVPASAPPNPYGPGALAAATPPPGYYRASDGRDYPIPQHLAHDPNAVRPQTIYAPPPPPAPAPLPPGTNPYAAAAPALPGPPPPAANPHAPPPELVPALIEAQASQPLPILIPAEAAVALDPASPPPVERKRRGGGKSKTAALPQPDVHVAASPETIDAVLAATVAGDCAAAAAEDAERTLHAATTEELVDVLAYRGYVVRLERPLRGGAS